MLVIACLKPGSVCVCVWCSLIMYIILNTYLLHKVLLVNQHLITLPPNSS